MFWRKNGGSSQEPTNVKRWMRNWQLRFASLGVQVVVADVAQSSVALDVAERTVVLAPSLEVSAAEKMLHKVYSWWQNHSARIQVDQHRDWIIFKGRRIEQ